ncbi:MULTISPECIES: hypothetical protein [Phocaeicola]|uniref:DUF790 family protein n=2 Tax=Phocaeicola TaxID=909656 RepID=A0AAW5N0N4_9BACT|nr:MULTISPECIES: hypothetical protein [Phocaeicola]MBD8003132.1 hypothetical protein [Phocaeicola faecium]MCR8873867.1 DUF790 family protein [Phocaeicola barnesiae]
MNKPKLDYNNVSEAILQKCNQLLLNVDVNTVSDAFDAVSEIVEIAIEKYSFDVSDYWKVENTDADIERKIRFTDINEGYEILVKKWVKQNPFKAELPDVPMDTSEPYEEYVKKLRMKAFAIGTAGTVAIGTAYAINSSHAKGWLIFGNPIVAIAAELIGIALIYTTVKYKENAKRQEIERQLRELEEKQKDYKAHLIETLTVAAEYWLKNAESYSDNIIKTF